MKDIVQNIKLKAETDQATKKLDQMKRSMNQIPKQLDINTQKSQKALANMKTAFVGLTAVAVAAFATIRKGFTGIATQQDAITRFNSALQMTGNTANMSSQSLFKYFNTLQKGLGQSATDLLDIASKFVQAGVSSQSMVRQYTRAAIGLAKQSGQSIETVADKLVSAMLGRAGALKQFGINAKQTGSAADALAQAINRGAIAFNNIDPNDTGRSLQILKQSWEELIQNIARPLVPGIVKGVRLLADNINAIGKVLTTGAIYIGLRSAVRLTQAVVGWGAARLAQIKIQIADQTHLNRLSVNKKMNAAVSLALQQGQIVNYSKILSMGAQELAQNTALLGIKTAILNIVKSTNFLVLAGTVALSLILNNWTKIKQAITGVSQQERKLWASSARLLGNQISQMAELLGQLKWYANQQKLTNEQIKHRNELIETYNESYAQKYGGYLLNQKTLITDIDQATKDLTITLKKLTQQKIKQALIESKTDVFIKYAQNIIKAQQLANKFKQQLDTINLGLYYEESEAQKSSWDTRTKYLQLKINQQQNIIAKWKGKIQKQFQDIVKITSMFTVQVPGKGNGDDEGKGKPPKPIKLKPPIVDTSVLQYFKSLLAGAQITKNVAAQTSSLKDIILQLFLEQRKYIMNTSDSDKETITFITTIQNMTNEIDRYKNKLKELNAVPPVPDPFTGPALKDIPVSPLDERIVNMFERLKSPTLELENMMATAFDNISSSIFGMFDRLGNGFAQMIIQGKSFGQSMKGIFKDFAKVVIAQLTKIIIKMAAMQFLKILLSGFGFTVGGPIGSVAGSALGTVLGTDATSNTNLSYSTGPMISKLDNIVDAINNFDPIQTQVIDLPTLSNANRIGNAMQLQGI